MRKKSPRRPPRQRAATKPLVDWREPERNARVLDWRERAHEFGLVPIDENGSVDGLVVEPADRLIQEEEPEAFEEQPVEAAEREQATDEESEESVDAGVPEEDPELVRVYLRTIGRHKLLTGAEEQAIGRTIEVARGDLLAALVTIPAARSTLLALADTVRKNEAPAAELILLPDGGELKPERVGPVLRALARVRRLERQIEEKRRGATDRRATAESRAKCREDLERLHSSMQALVRDLPIRPAVVDDIVSELRQLEDQFK